MNIYGNKKLALLFLLPALLLLLLFVYYPHRGELRPEPLSLEGVLQR